MVMLAAPLASALAAARAAQRAAGCAATRTLYLSPAGTPLSHRRVAELAAAQRRRHWYCSPGGTRGSTSGLLEREVDEEVAIGDFVVSGGELPALMLIDGILRLRPGVLNDAESRCRTRSRTGCSSCPHYTRPDEYDGMRGARGSLSETTKADPRVASAAGASAALGGAGPTSLRDRVLSKEEPSCSRPIAANGCRISGLRRKWQAAGSGEAVVRQRTAFRRTTKPRASGGALRCAQGQRPAISEMENAAWTSSPHWKREEIERLARRYRCSAPGDTCDRQTSNVVEGERQARAGLRGRRHRPNGTEVSIRRSSYARYRCGEACRGVPSDLFRAHRRHRGQAQGRRAPREALLPPRSVGKSRGIREKLAHTHKEAGLGNTPRAAWPPGLALDATCLGRISRDSSIKTGISPPAEIDESLALRSAGNPADRVRRGSSRALPASDPQVLRHDA